MSEWGADVKHWMSERVEVEVIPKSNRCKQEGGGWGPNFVYLVITS